MLRYFKRHLPLAALAVLLGILTQLLTPLSAVLEQRMIDLIVSGDISGFLRFLWVAAGAVLAVATGYFLDGITEKWFTFRFWESLRNDLYDAIMARSVPRFGEKDTAEYLSHITGTVGTVVQNLTRPVFYLISYGVSALVVLGIMIWYSPLLAALSVLCGGLSMILPLRFNICLGEEFSEEALTRALRRSGVERFLKAIPGGLDGPCGENGSKLSGGERQRVALARAMIREVQVLILDEGVSAIDVATANEIERELLEMRDLTLLTVTHRLQDGLTRQYDRILVMEGGTVREEREPFDPQANGAKKQ